MTWRRGRVRRVRVPAAGSFAAEVAFTLALGAGLYLLMVGVML